MRQSQAIGESGVSKAVTEFIDAGMAQIEELVGDLPTVQRQEPTATDLRAKKSLTTTHQVAVRPDNNLRPQAKMPESRQRLAHQLPRPAHARSALPHPARTPDG